MEFFRNLLKKKNEGQASQPKSQLEAKSVSETKEGIKFRVLAADDHMMSRELVALTCEREGFKVKVLEDGDKLLAEISREGVKYDVIVSDNQMPGKDGVDILKEIRLRGDSTPFVLTTSDNSDKLREEVKKLNGIFFQKPVDPVRLVSILKEIKEKKEKEQK